MKLSLGLLLLAVVALPGASFAITDDELNYRAEYRAKQSEARRAAKEAARLEELKHIKELDVNSLLKTIADEDDQISEVVVIYKNGVKDRYIAPAK